MGDEEVGPSTGRGRGSRLRARRAGTSPVPRAGISSRLEKINIAGTEDDTGLVGGKVRGRGSSIERGSGLAHRGLRIDRYDSILTRSKDTKKKGQSGQLIGLLSNYFVVKKGCSWSLYQYRVDFSPAVDKKTFKKKLVRDNKDKIGPYLFDGTMLFSPKELDPGMQLESFDEIKKEAVSINIKFARKLIPGDMEYIQFYNIMLRKCLYGMELQELGRHFYDPVAIIKNAQFGLELWPGYVTSIRSHEKEVLLCVEVTHKVIRMETVLDTIRKLKASPGDFHQAVTQALVGSIVLTNYNNKTYKINDIDWKSTPMSTFDKKGEQVTFAKYYQDHYGLNFTDTTQPLLVAASTKKDLHRGQVEGSILLIPEACQMTGLTDAMRANFNLMKSLAQHLHMDPAKKIEALKRFMDRLLNIKDGSLTKELSDWGLEFTNELVKCEGRVMPREGIVFGPGGDNKPELPNEKADFTMAFRKRQMLKCIKLENWAILVPQRDAANVDNWVRTMIQVSKPLGIFISPPSDIIKISDPRTANYVTALDNLLARGNLQLVFVVLPNNKLELYAAVKKRLSMDFGIPSQCFLAKNLTNKGLMSIATKVVVQINAKLGGEPWSVQVPLKNMMVLGFDAYRGGAAGVKDGAKGAIGALVASLNGSFSKYFSTISRHNGLEDLANNLIVDVSKCLDAYKLANNGVLPERIIFYRDGVGEGQLAQVYNTELVQLQTSLNTYYTSAGSAIPKFTFIVVTKKINTRFFTSRSDNPPPGTVVDDVVTLPERFDFYLVTGVARQGTVNPVSYNVLCDTQGLDADKIQRITHKMCHLYYNWSGAVAVPAQCQYAHKLAFLAGMALGGTGQPHPNLSNKLHFL